MCSLFILKDLLLTLNVFLIHIKGSFSHTKNVFLIHAKDLLLTLKMSSLLMLKDLLFIINVFFTHAKRSFTHLEWAFFTHAERTHYQNRPNQYCLSRNAPTKHSQHSTSPQNEADLVSDTIRNSFIAASSAQMVHLVQNILNTRHSPAPKPISFSDIGFCLSAQFSFQTSDIIKLRQ